MKRTIALTDRRISAEVERTLTLRGYTVLTLPPFPALSPAVASHTDMLLCRLGDEVISVADYCDVAPHIFTDLVEMLGGSGIKVAFTADSLSGEYPNDCRLNVLVMGEHIFLKADSVSPYILEKAAVLGLKTVNIKQGYPACTVLRLDGTHAITADKGMARAMREVGITVCEISNGGIQLPPYEYGFIGDCAGVHGGRVYFCGDVSTHPDGDKILTFCRECGYEVVSLSRGPLLDVGGILFIEGNVN